MTTRRTDVPIDETAHLRRDRAESFGAVAADYDRYRPGYPAALIADLVALRPAQVLDVGCGTGKAARLLAASGLSVLGVEPDPKMAAVARAHGLDVEPSSLEEWDDRGRRYDLITSAQAWHWVDPQRGAAKAARLLRPGGTLAPFWNFDDVDEPTRTALNEVYAQLAPDLQHLHTAGARHWQRRSYAADLRAGGIFADVTTRTYPWRRRETVEHWVARLGTQSEHLLLGAERLRALQAAIAEALSALGPDVPLEGGTYLILARVVAR